MRSCRVSDLGTSTDGLTQALAGGELYSLTLTNRSASACSVYGRPTSAQATQRGRTFPIKMFPRPLFPSPVDQPESPGTVILPPGRSAYIALTSSHANGYNRTVVYSALSFRIQSVGARLTWHGAFEPDNGFGIGPVTLP